MIVFGLAEAIGGFIAGRVSDKIKNGRRLIIGLGVVFQVAGLGETHCPRLHSHADSALRDCQFVIKRRPLLRTVAASRTIRLLLSDPGGGGSEWVRSMTSCQLMSILGDAFTENSADAFAVFKLVQSVAATIAFLVTPKFGDKISTPEQFREEIYVDGGLLVAGTVGLLMFFSLKQVSQKKSDGSVDKL